MILCHKIRLKTNKTQEEYLRGCSGINRLTWNWITDKFNQKESKFNTLNLKKEFNQIKHTDYPFINLYPKDCNQETFTDFNKTIQQFFKRKKGFPKFKSIHNSKRSFSLSNDKFTIKDDKLCFKKYKFKLTESIRFAGKIKTLRILEDGSNKWFACFFIDLEIFNKDRISNNKIGIDMGLKTFIHTSNNEIYNYPKKLKVIHKRIKRAQRKISRRKKGSKNREKVKIIYRELWNKVRNVREEVSHQISTKINKENQFIVMEDLNVKGMMKNHRLANAIGNACWSIFRSKMEYKALIYGNKLIIADRFYPSSKTCSKCGWKNKDLKLTNRIFECKMCDMKIDRDLNASINLKNLIDSSTEGYSGIQACGSLYSGTKQEII